MRSPVSIKIRQSTKKVYAYGHGGFDLYFRVDIECVEPSGCPEVAIEVEGEKDVRSSIFTEPVNILAWRERGSFYGLFKVSGRKIRGERRKLGVGIVRVNVGGRRVYGRRLCVDLVGDLDDAWKSADVELAVEVMRIGGLLEQP